MGLCALLPLTLGPLPPARARALASKIRRAQRSFKHETLVVVRYTKNGQWATARPCSDCAAMLQRIGVRRVAYSTPEGMCTQRVRDLESRPTVTRRICPPVHVYTPPPRACPD